jgi:GNAT superfamily N-acetyltransferase
MMDIHYHIRPALPQDACGIAHVYVEAWRSAYAGILPTRMLVNMSKRRQIRSWQGHINRILSSMKGRDAIFVAKSDDGPVIGFGNSGVCREASLGFSTEIYTLYVDPNYLDLGIGHALLKRLFSNLVGLGHETALIWTLADNPNRHFYAAQGGRFIAERSSYYWGKPLREMAYGWSTLTEWCEQQSSVRSLPH